MVATITRQDGGRGAVTFRPTGDADADLRQVSTAVDRAFGVDGLRALRWTARVGDYPSRRLAWASGFTFDGAVRAGWIDGDELAPSWVGTLLVDDRPGPKTTWLDTPTFDGGKVVLRELTEGDGPRFLQTNVDQESLVWLGTIPFARTPREFDTTYLTRQVGASLGAGVTWTIADPADDRYLGTINLFDLLGLDYRSAEVGYRSHPDTRGRGVVSAALRTVVQHAFTNAEAGGLGLFRLRLGVGDGNLGSQGVARSCGFTETGRDRSCYDRPDGSVLDLVRFDLLATDLLATDPVAGGVADGVAR